MINALRILLIDDNPDDRAMVIRELRREFSNLQVKQLTEREGFAQALNEGAFDLVITDYQIRWTDGLTVLETIKCFWPDCPVIMFTATGSEEIAVQAMKAGLHDYILKSPKHFVRLPAAVRSALERVASDRRTVRLETRLSSLLNRLNVGAFRSTTDGRLLEANPAFLRLLGFKSLQEAKALDLQEFDLWPQDRSALLAQLKETGPIQGREVQFIRKDGRRIWVSLTHSLGTSGNGELLIDSLAEDITQRKQAEEALRQSEVHMRAILDTALDAVIAMDELGLITYWNPRAEAIFGWTHEEAVGRSLCETIIPSQYQAAHIRGLKHFLATGEGPVLNRRIEITALRRDGTEFPVELSIIPLKMGESYQFHAFIADITERKRAEKEKAALEAQLRQAQKMEAIGQLASGVAHDFNNFLTVINSYTDMLLQAHLAPDDPMRREVEPIKEAGERSALLTRQLLTFGRRERISPIVLNLNALVSNLAKMLKRLIGEDITLTMKLYPELGNVKVDPGQIEQAIMNLAVNARDAMPSGGHLTIETANVELHEAYAFTHIAVRPGPYVMLAVSDTGIGMDAETQSHLFEPFFTTKEPGKGTGLGLSTVYGIVKQSGGNIWVYSELGRGSTFKIYLPKVQQEVTADARDHERAESTRGWETVLLVEDEEMVRTLARTILKSHGYTVLEARDGNEALRIAQEYDGPIHLLMTDVVMPGINGQTLAERLVSVRPTTRVLYMSGYTGNAITRQGLPDPGISYLQKPFTPSVLARTVRDVLDSPLVQAAGSSC